MEPEFLPPAQGGEVPPKSAATQDEAAPHFPPGFAPESAPKPDRPVPGFFFEWVLIGDDGLRAGWSVLLFAVLAYLMMFASGMAISFLLRYIFHPEPGGMTPVAGLVSGAIELLGILFAGTLVARLERRRLRDFNLSGSRSLLHFGSGLVAGFAALSALVAAMAWGGWLHFDPVALSAPQILGFALLWGVVFLIVGLCEEGTFRGYLQYTLTRGLNFWWALGIIGQICFYLLVRAKGNGAWGVYGFALLGLPPCLFLYLNRAQRSSFWYAAWVSSTLFGFIHTGNNGENWIGIFAAALIGFVFCVSIRVTGSAWWAIGCHAAWDWAETFFYGTADSGLVASGHFLSTKVSGNPLWSGGADGPEGSLLVLPVILALLVATLAIYGRRSVRRSEQAA
jgi:membrane protease YdiL (CAAX protease family)